MRLLYTKKTFMILFLSIIFALPDVVVMAKKRDEIIVAFPRRPESLVPYFSTDPYSRWIWDIMFNGLIGYDQHREIVPGLAVEWRFDPADNSIEFFLRRDMVWSIKDKRGYRTKVFSAHDVKFTIDALLDDRSQDMLQGHYAKTFESAEVMDNYRIKIRLNRSAVIIEEKTEKEVLEKFRNLKVIPENFASKKYVHPVIAWDLILKGLVEYDRDHILRPGLAEGWKFDSNNNSIEFRLRKDVVWIDNRDRERGKFSASDVRHTIDVFKKRRGQTIQKYEHLKNIKSVKIIDNHRIKVIFKRSELTIKDTAEADILNSFVFEIISRKNASQKEPYIAIVKNRTEVVKFLKQPLGTGSFVYDITTRAFDFVRNKNYFKKKKNNTTGNNSKSKSGLTNIQRIIYKIYEDDVTMCQNFMDGSIDLMGEFSYQCYEDLTKSGVRDIHGKKVRYGLQEINKNRIEYIAFNLRRPHLEKKPVREAMNKAFNREQLAENLYKGAAYIITGPFPEGSPEYNTKVEWEHDPEYAEFLLGKAGYKKKGRFFTDEKEKPIKFEMIVKDKDELSGNIDKYIAFESQMEDLGIKIDIKKVSPEEWTKRVIDKQNFDLAWSTWFFGEYISIYTLFHGRFSSPGQNNFTGYNNPEVDKLLDDVYTDISYSRNREAKFDRLHKIIAEDLPYLFLWTAPKFVAWTEDKFVEAPLIFPYNIFLWIDNWQVEYP